VTGSRRRGGPAGEARLFVALDLPVDIREQLGWWGREARRECGPMRLIDTELLHVTLAFLGARPVAEIDPIGAAVAGVDEGVSRGGRLALGAPVWLPRRRPRLLAVELHDDEGGLAALHSALSVALAAAVDWTPERRAFHPHVTVARMRADGGGSGSAARRGALPATPSASFGGEALTLYRSWLQPSGAVYEALERVGLGG